MSKACLQVSTAMLTFVEISHCLLLQSAGLLMDCSKMIRHVQQCVVMQIICMQKFGGLVYFTSLITKLECRSCERIKVMVLRQFWDWLSLQDEDSLIEF